MKFWPAYLAVSTLMLGAVGTYLVLEHVPTERVDVVPQTEVATTTTEIVPVATTTPAMVEEKRAEPFTSSLEELMASKQNYGCHYKSPPEEGNFTGTVHVSEGRARGTVVGEVFGPGTIISFLFNDDHVYLWYVPNFDESMKGTAMLIEATTTKDKSTTRHDIMDNLTELYGCVSWEFDDAFFELPDDIVFVKPEEGWLQIEVVEED